MFTDNESQEVILARLCPCDYTGQQYAKVKYTPKEPKIVNNNTLSTSYNSDYPTLKTSDSRRRCVK